MSAEKQQYLKETWQIEQGGSRAKRYGIDEGRDRRAATTTSSSSSLSWLWLCLVIVALGAGIWLFVLLVRGAKTQIEAGSPTPSTVSSNRR
jgi:hypothetical protein